MASLLEWLLKHPPFLIVVLVVAVIAVVVWIAAPIDWRDGEGRPESDGGWLRALGNLLDW